MQESQNKGILMCKKTLMKKGRRVCLQVRKTVENRKGGQKGSHRER